MLSFSSANSSSGCRATGFQQAAREYLYRWHVLKWHGQSKLCAAVRATLPLFPSWAWTAPRPLRLCSSCSEAKSRSNPQILPFEGAIPRHLTRFIFQPMRVCRCRLDRGEALVTCFNYLYQTPSQTFAFKNDERIKLGASCKQPLFGSPIKFCCSLESVSPHFILVSNQ